MSVPRAASGASTAVGCAGRAAWLGVLGVVLLGTALVGAEGVAVAILFATCGLGMPLLVLPTLAAVLACATPVVLARGRGRIPGGAASLALLLAYALVPARCSRAEADAEVARVTAADVAPVAPAVARTLELVRPEAEDANLSEPLFGGDVCGAACRAALIGDEVDWVRVVTVGWAARGRPPEERGRVRLARATGAACAGPDAPAGSDAACVIFVPDDPTPAGLVLRIEDGTGAIDPPAAGSGWAHPGGHRRATVTGADGAVLLRTTEVRLGVVFAPTVVVAALTGMSSHGFELVRTSERRGAVTLAGVLRALGYRLDHLDAAVAALATPRDWRTPPDEEATRRVVSILDLPGDAPFAASQQQAVADWLASARTWSRDGGWTQGRIDVLRRVVVDPRVEGAWPLDQIVERTPEVAAAVLPDVLDRTEALGVPARAPWTQAWYGLERGDPAVLVDHADRIAALLDADPGGEGLLLPLAGRLDRDPTRWLLPLEGAADDRRDALLAGLCHASVRWSSVLAPPLRAWLDAHVRDADVHEDDKVAAARALARHGDPEGARTRLLALGEDGERAWRRLEGDLRRAGTQDAVCR